MPPKSLSAAIASNRKIVKAAKVFADCAADEVAWMMATKRGRKLRRQTISTLREHITTVVVQNIQSLAEALAEDDEGK